MCWPYCPQVLEKVSRFRSGDIIGLSRINFIGCLFPCNIIILSPKEYHLRRKEARFLGLTALETGNLGMFETLPGLLDILFRLAETVSTDGS